MYKKQRPKLSVTAVINSAQNSNSTNWFNGTNGCQVGMLTNGQLNAPSTPTNIDLITSDGINYTPNLSTFSQMSNTNTSINNSSFDHPSLNSNHGESGLASKYPPNHPLSGSKHLCAICGDRASGRHYGLYSCEGCKGFFKRTVRKDLTYACREDRNCIIDKRQRNRCQYCRYQKCLIMGMKREAVQEERQRNKEKSDNEVESSTTMCPINGSLNNNFQIEISPEKILNAEIKVEQRCQELTNEDHNFNSLLFGNSMIDDNNNNNLNTKCLLECYQMIEWAKEIPYFAKLPIEDRIALLKSGWNELLIVQFSHRSMHVKDGIQLAAGVTLHRNDAQTADVGGIYDRVLIELVAKMQEIRMDKCELGCLRAVVLFNPEAKGLKSIEKVEQLREVVYSTLEKYCHTKYTDQNSRFAKLLLRLPALRSVGLKCVDYLFINRDWNEQQMDNYLKHMLEKRTFSPSSHNHQSSPINNSMNSSLNNSLIGANSSINSINDNHLTAHQTMLIPSNNLMRVIDSNNNLTNNSNSNGFNDLSAINFMGSNTVSTMGNLISLNATANNSNGLYISNTVSNANSISNLSINQTNSPLSLT